MKKKDIYKQIDIINTEKSKDRYTEFERLLSFFYEREEKIEAIKYFFLSDKFKCNNSIEDLLGYDLKFFKFITRNLNDLELVKQYVEQRKQVFSSQFNKLVSTQTIKGHSILNEYEELLLSMYKIKKPDFFIKELHKQGKLKEFKENCFKAFYSRYPKVSLNNLDLILDSYGYNNPKTKEYLLKMQKIDSNSIKNLDYNLLQDKYISIFTPYQMCLISHDIYLMYFLHNITDKEYIFIKYILSNIKYNNDFEEYFYYIKRNIKSYQELINNMDFNSITEEELFILRKLITYENIWNIKKPSDLNDIEKLYNKAFKEACKIFKEESERVITVKELIENNRTGKGITRIKNLITVKKFGIDKSFDEKVKAFQEDSEPFEYKKYSDSVDKIQVLERLIKTYKSIETIHPLLDKISYIRYYRYQYEQIFNEQLFDISKAKKIKIEGKTYYDPGDSFYILMTSKSPIIKTDKEYQSLKQDWNRLDVESSFFCASIISDFMLHFCETDLKVYYGFNKIKSDSLLSMGPDDLGSYTDLDCFSLDPMFYTPFDLCYNTVHRLSPCYNEIDIKRYSKGIKIQPDYIVSFKLKGEIKNKYESSLASKQFGNIPIVLIDIDKCIDNNTKELNNYIEEYKNNQTPELKDIIFKKSVLLFGMCKKYDVIPLVDESDLYRIFNKDKQYNIRYII